MNSWRANVPLAPRTTLEVGGEAEYFFEAWTTKQLRDALQEARHHNLPVTVLGGGSNVLIADAGLRGLVLSFVQDEIDVEGSQVRVSAGTSWDVLVEFCVSRGLAGLECLSGIPGRVGAAPIQNIGAYGRDVSEAIERVEVLDRSSLETRSFECADCQFSYRSSAFKTAWRDRYIVTALHLRLESGGTPELRYRDLLGAFGTRTPPIRDVRETVLEIRARKSMVWNSSDPNHRSAGSFFVNPIVAPQVADRIDDAAGTRAPRFPTASRDVKLPAAWLIERAGFHKGLIRGNAGISSAHALALINRGEARASEIVSLAREIQDAVHTKFGVELRPEPVWLGFD
ncbi:MAG: UDP-N-acetylmuramate dehydrogenase [Myxococcota bacterium]